MRSRQQITELFSTFLQFEADHFERWITDARLRRRMQQLQITEASASEQFWVMYWHKRWQNQHQPADLHLIAYVQESCYWAAQQTVRKFADLQYRLSDCFQIAISEVNTVLKGFNSERGASLKTYATMAFSSILRDALRQRQIVDLCSNWTLLRRISKKRLLEALKAGGVTETAMAHYHLAWVCFKALYVPATPAERFPKLDTAFWEQVAQLYNTERQQLVAPASAITAATLERWLTQTASWIRGYLYPAVGSLNTPKFGEDTTEVQDTLAATGESLLNQLVAEEEISERTDQQTQLNQALSTAITQLDNQSQEILRLYYQQRLTQQQIMRELALSQASVSRRLSKAREHLLAATVQWSQSLNIGINPALIKEMSTALDEWLNLRYQPTSAAPTT